MGHKLIVKDRDSSSGIPAWELYVGDKYVGYATPTLFSRGMVDSPRFYTAGKLAVYLSFGTSAVDLTDTSSYDTAVPINADHTFPFGGDAVTVYESNDLLPGIVPMFTVHHIVGAYIDNAVRELYGLGSKS